MDSDNKVCVVIGADGRLGRVLTDEALKRGYTVRGVIYKKSKKKKKLWNGNEKVELTNVKLDDIGTLMEIFHGAEAIFFVVRGKRCSRPNQLVGYIRNITDALVDDDYDLKVGVDRMIICSSIATSREGYARLSWVHKMENNFNEGMIRDMKVMEDSCLHGNNPNFISKLTVVDFTIVKPVKMLEKGPSNARVVGFQDGEARRIRTSIPMVDVANFMFDVCINGGGYSRDSVMIGLEP